jgi:hypothetical protein
VGIGAGGGEESNCSGEGCAGWKLFELPGRSANGLLVIVCPGFNDSGTFSAGELSIVTCPPSEDPGAGWHSWSPIAEISISSPQFEHFMVGRKLAGRIPPAARVAASDILRSYRCDTRMVLNTISPALPRSLHRFGHAQLLFQQVSS